MNAKLGLFWEAARLSVALRMFQNARWCKTCNRARRFTKGTAGNPPLPWGAPALSEGLHSSFRSFLVRLISHIDGPLTVCRSSSSIRLLDGDPLRPPGLVKRRMRDPVLFSSDLRCPLFGFFDRGLLPQFRPSPVPNGSAQSPSLTFPFSPSFEEAARRRPLRAFIGFSRYFFSVCCLPVGTGGLLLPSPTRLLERGSPNWPTGQLARFPGPVILKLDIVDEIAPRRYAHKCDEAGQKYACPAES